MNRFALLIGIALLGGCAAEATEVPLAEDGFGVTGGKADGGDDINVQDYRGGQLVTLYGEPAADLWNILEDAGHPVRPWRGLERVGTSYIVCVTNRSAAACQLFTRDASDVDGFDLAIHGQRFRSASSDLFGAIASVTDTDARSTNSVEYAGYFCEKGGSEVWCGRRAAGDDTVTLELSLAGLGDLGPDYVYEGWLITSEGPVTSGRFGLEAGDEVREFEIDAALAADSTMFVLTIEPALGDDPAPADTHVVAGVFNDGNAALDTLHPAALGTDFSEAMGAYILETPSSAASDDYNQGVWFVNPAAGAASLDLPTLPSGWVYEGWVVGEDGPVSTGTFLDPAGADSDGGGPAAGPNGTPPFPGQDFIDPARDLLGGAVVISVEPSPDNSPAPFFLKPLVDGAADDVGAGTLQDMGNNAAASAIFGSASFR
ncbi:MAG: anti-sigma factor [Sandaracinaceae bacterium]